MRAVCEYGVTALLWLDTLGGQNPLGVVVRAENNHTHVIPAASADRANGYSPVTTRAINHENRSKRSVEGQMYFFWAVSGAFIITTRGIFRFDVGIDATNPKKWRKNIMCTWKTAWPLLWHDHELRILAETIFLTSIGMVFWDHKIFVELRIAGLHVLVWGHRTQPHFP